jgi:hypothetical protein
MPTAVAHTSSQSPSPPSPEFCVARLDRHDQERQTLYAELIESLKPSLRANMARDGRIDYWQVYHLGAEFPGKQVTYTVINAVADSLVKAGEWLQSRDPDRHGFWVANPDFSPDDAG